MYLKFSHDGLRLAVATGQIINIYSVPEYKLIKQLIGHQGNNFMYIYIIFMN